MYCPNNVSEILRTTTLFLLARTDFHFSVLKAIVHIFLYFLQFINELFIIYYNISSFWTNLSTCKEEKKLTG